MKTAFLILAQDFFIKLYEANVWEYEIEKPADEVREKLQEIFNMNLIKSLGDVKYRFGGHFDKENDNCFTIETNNGMYVTGGRGYALKGRISVIDASKCKIKIEVSPKWSNLISLGLGGGLMVLLIYYAIQQEVTFWLELESWGMLLSFFTAFILIRGLFIGTRESLRRGLEKALEL